jgi:uncharacterized protein (TIGR02246 family)
VAFLAAPEEVAVRELFDQLVERYNNQDAKAIAELFASDADAITAFNKYKGREQIEQLFTGFEGDRVETPDVSIRFLTDRVALMDFEIKLSGLRGVNQEKLPPMRIQAALIATKENGLWQFSALRIRTFTTAQ